MASPGSRDHPPTTTASSPSQITANQPPTKPRTAREDKAASARIVHEGSSFLDVAKALYVQIGPKSIDTLQPMSKSTLVVTFTSASWFGKAMALGSLDVNGTQIPIDSIEAPTMTVLMKDAPKWLSREAIANALLKYGELREMSFDVHKEGILQGVKNGDRRLRVKVKTQIPNILIIAGYRIQMFYPGVAKQCFRCKATTHRVKDCPRPRHAPMEGRQSNQLIDESSSQQSQSDNSSASEQTTSKSSCQNDHHKDESGKEDNDDSDEGSFETVKSLSPSGSSIVKELSVSAKGMIGERHRHVGPAAMPFYKSTKSDVALPTSNLKAVSGARTDDNITPGPSNDIDGVFGQAFGDDMGGDNASSSDEAEMSDGDALKIPISVVKGGGSFSDALKSSSPVRQEENPRKKRNLNTNVKKDNNLKKLKI